MPPRVNPPSTPTPSVGDTISVDQLASVEARLQDLLDQQLLLQQENMDLRLQVNSLAQPSQADLDVRAASEADSIDTAVPRPERGISMAPTSLTQSGYSEPKVASPEFFSGQRNKLSTFLTQVSMVIALQPARFPSEMTKILYAGSFLRDTAFLWFQPFVVLQPPPLFMQGFEAFCTELRKTFGDPDEVGSAERQLYLLRQRTSVSSYLADFTRLSVLVKWNSEAKAAQFYRGLKDNLKDELARGKKWESLTELQETSLRIDARLFERQIERGDRSAIPGYLPPAFRARPLPTVGRPRPPFDSEHSLSANLHTISPPRPPPSRTLTNRGKLTPAEYQRRKDLALCLYCGDKGHAVLNCPIASPSRRPSTFQATASLPKPSSTFSGKA